MCASRIKQSSQHVCRQLSHRYICAVCLRPISLYAVYVDVGQAGIYILEQLIHWAVLESIMLV